MRFLPNRGLWWLVSSAVAFGIFFDVALRASAIDCTALLPAFQQGAGDVDIARAAGLPVGIVSSCRAELSRPIHLDPAGPPPMGAVGQPPLGAPGRPPLGAVGPPPVGAAGPPPVGRDVRRLP
ncbi:MAG TPA: hypothetical protein VMT89_10055 [Candidatus Acidoferrales bacterium]|nr:hypothetical protein [Candidatus Acidoferrales bacterium]